jgi:hypothetical protein
VTIYDPRRLVDVTISWITQKWFSNLDIIFWESVHVFTLCKHSAYPFLVFLYFLNCFSIYFYIFLTILHKLLLIDGPHCLDGCIVQNLRSVLIMHSPLIFLPNFLLQFLMIFLKEWNIGEIGLLYFIKN